MSDGHTDGWRRNYQPLVRDVTGRDVNINDAVFIAGREGDFVRGNVVEVDIANSTLVVITKSNSYITIDLPFHKDNRVPVCNKILRE